MAHTLILLRHGESDWNQKNLFTGWVDVDLTDKGRAEAARGGQLLKDAGILPDVVHTSVLRRAITTANLALDAADRHWIPVRRSWRLNERHYGALQGLDKAATRDKYGDEQFMLWRRSFDTPPPPIEAGSEFDQTSDPRYAGVDVPLTECLADVIPRMMPYWENDIQADLRKYAEEVGPVARDKAGKLAPTVLGPILEEKFTEDELKQLIAIIESPVNRKYQALGVEMQKALSEKLVAEMRPMMETKLRGLQQSIAGRLAPAAPAASGAGAGK